MAKKPSHIGHENFHPSLDEGIDMLEKISRVKIRLHENSAGFMLGNTAGRLKLELLRTFKTRGYSITPEQWIVLNTVAENGGVCQRDLAEMTFKDRPTITRILDILEEKKLISRRPDNSDRRMFNVYLTDEGKKNIETFNSIVSDVDRKAFGNLPEQELVRFKKILSKLMENLDSQ
jgi:DNA-binding MarR family transcriptional regulator